MEGGREGERGYFIYYQNVDIGRRCVWTFSIFNVGSQSALCGCRRGLDRGERGGETIVLYCYSTIEIH